MIRRHKTTAGLSRALFAALCGCVLALASAPASSRLAAAQLNLPALLPRAPAGAALDAQPEFLAELWSTDRDTGDFVFTGSARGTYGNSLLTADEIRYNRETKIATARGNNKFTSATTQGNALLTADEIFYDAKTQTATARGRVEFTNGALRLLADEFAYRTADGAFTLAAPRLGGHPYYISGKTAAGVVSATGTTSIALTDAIVTLQEPGEPLAPTLRAGTLTLTHTSVPSTRAAAANAGSAQPPPWSAVAEGATATGDTALDDSRVSPASESGVAGLRPLPPHSKDTAAANEQAVGTPASTFPGAAAPTVNREPGTVNSGGEAAATAATTRIQTSNTRIGLGPLSFIKLPRLTRSVDHSILSYLTASAGYRGNLGAFLNTGARFPVADGLRLGADAGFYTKRGLLAGPAASYDIPAGASGAGRVTGSLETGYIHDYGNRLADILARPIDIDRGFVTWRHDQAITPDLRLFGQANYWSDSGVIRDFRSGQFSGVQQPDNFLELDYTQPNYIISLFARADFNACYPVRQRLPELRFDLLPSLIGVQGIYQRAFASAAVLHQRESFWTIRDPQFALRNTSRPSRRLDAYYALYRPIAHKDIATLTPVAGARATYYADALDAAGGSGNYTRILGEIGFDAELRAAGIFACQNKKWDIDGLRHLVTPRLSYRYIPQAGKGASRIPLIDDQVFTTYLQPLGLGDIRNIDQISPTNTLRLGLDNTLQTRDKTHGSRDLATLNLAADYRLDAESRAGARPFSAVHATLALMPARWLSLGLYSSVEPRGLALRELNTGLRIHDGQRWSLALSTHYLREQINEYIAEGRYRINETFETYARVHYDNREHRFNERSFGVIQKLGHNLWTIRYGVTMYQGATRESNFGFSVDVRLMNF